MTSNTRGIGMTSQRTRDRLVRRLGEQGVSDSRVLAAIAQTPRHLFVDEALAHRAYEDTALPIGSGQTISQPFVVGLMTELLMVNSPRKILEIGTGCGYQTTVLAELCDLVWTIERIPELSKRARVAWRKLGLRNVHAKLGDGYKGWPDLAPFDAIMVTAAAPDVPQVLVSQLAEGGRLVIPVGDEQQSLWVIDKTAEGISSTKHDAVHFVPMLPGVRRHTDAG